MKGRRQPISLEEVVGGLVRKWEKGEYKRGNAVRAAWLSSAGQEAAGHTQPVSFKKGILMVVVENSGWLYKLTMEKRNIIAKFNEEYTGRQKLAEIRFRIGKTELDG